MMLPNTKKCIFIDGQRFGLYVSFIGTIFLPIACSIQLQERDLFVDTLC